MPQGCPVYCKSSMASLKTHASPPPSSGHGPTRTRLACLQAGGWKIMTTLNMCIIFFIFGITLETSELKEALKAVRYPRPPAHQAAAEASSLAASPAAPAACPAHPPSPCWAAALPARQTCADSGRTKQPSAAAAHEAPQR
jgi:hypothetical protein